MMVSQDTTQKSEQESGNPNVEEVMSRIRDRVRASLESATDMQSVLRRTMATSDKGSIPPVLYSDELNYLNANWHHWVTSSEIHSHRRFIGRAVSKLKKFMVQAIWEHLLKDYIEKERNFNANLVRFLNSTARYIDARDSEIFWELIRKLDHDLESVRDELARVEEELRRTAVTLGMDTRAAVARSESVALGTENLVSSTRAELMKMDEMVRGLERALALKTSRGAAIQAGEEKTGDNSAYRPLGEVPENSGEGRSNLELEYLLLENRFRGSETDIIERQKPYVELLRGLPGPVLELGCGRGEMLTLLRDGGIEARGIDLDLAMVLSCKEKGLNVFHGDALLLLQQEPDSSLGAVIALQLVEHLGNEQLDRLFTLCLQKLRPGGKVLFETVNPQSYTALARNFFRDPTHRWPLHPDTLRFMLEMKGFQTKDILLGSPYPDVVKLRQVNIGAHLPERWQHTLHVINDNTEKLNDLLFGFQDYAALAQKPDLS